MPNNPILVRKISHLTDARYFAAMEVDWMSMDLTDDPASFSLWHALREWIEGVKLVAELKDEDESLFARVIIDARPDAILMPTYRNYEFPPQLHRFYLTDSLPEAIPEGMYIILSFDSGVTLPSFGAVKEWDKIFLEADWTPELLSDVLDSGYQGGVVLRGSEESEKGIKDFALTDELMSMLRGE